MCLPPTLTFGFTLAIVPHTLNLLRHYAKTAKAAAKKAKSSPIARERRRCGDKNTNGNDGSDNDQAQARKENDVY
ncbi:hypothetical protein HCBG_04942 [Histoplasma capsulatum G186AR]|uniref:Uncharacterized protein n=1 Tax=Ajellomyces capsulatus (strain G186AR / H82 / ATCC MYA-2454 / RMSCC 2432) TaxID=447093 RepID=C0NP62_AJECG|nr:uncharacterized protein HCBG_04942 [Histoplasma capsulatum G186AR]EEH06722.1 hypothetical protein HCBG_04942 [Histoplasma capsulatum G186AR]